MTDDKQQQTELNHDTQKAPKKWHPLSLIWLIPSIIVIILDQLSKLWIVTYLTENTPIHVTSFFSLRLLFNQGAAFSFLSQQGGWQVLFLSILAMVITLILFIWLLRTPAKRFFYCCGFSLVIGGAIGNLIDRLRLGHVIDFLYFHYHQYYWPAFNIADSCVCIGVFLLIIALWRHK